MCANKSRISHGARHSSAPAHCSLKRAHDSMISHIFLDCMWSMHGEPRDLKNKSHTFGNSAIYVRTQDMHARHCFCHLTQTRSDLYVSRPTKLSRSWGKRKGTRAIGGLIVHCSSFFPLNYRLFFLFSIVGVRLSLFNPEGGCGGSGTVCLRYVQFLTAPESFQHLVTLENWTANVIHSPFDALDAT